MVFGFVIFLGDFGISGIWDSVVFLLSERVLPPSVRVVFWQTDPV